MLREINQIKKTILPSRENNYRPSILDSRFLSYIALILFFLKFITLFYLVVMPKTSYFADIASGLLINMTNEERQVAGLYPLRINYQLTRAAELKAKDMVTNNYFSHWSPQGKSPWYWIEIAGYNYEYAGENLAMGFFDAKEVHNAWIASSSHRENIVNPNYKEVGIAVVESNDSGKSTFFVVQIFGTPKIELTHIALEEELPEKLIEELPKQPELLVQELVERQDLILETISDSINKDYQEEITEVSDEEATEEGSEHSVLGEYDTGIYIYPAGLIENHSLTFFEFLLVEYDELIQKITMIVLLFLGFVLLVNVFVRFDVQHPDLIFKGLAFLVLFILFDYFNQSTIIKIFFEIPIIQ